MCNTVPVLFYLDKNTERTPKAFPTRQASYMIKKLCSITKLPFLYNDFTFFLAFLNLYWVITYHSSDQLFSMAFWSVFFSHDHIIKQKYPQSNICILPHLAAVSSVFLSLLYIQSWT